MREWTVIGQVAGRAGLHAPLCLTGLRNLFHVWESALSGELKPHPEGMGHREINTK